MRHVSLALVLAASTLATADDGRTLEFTKWSGDVNVPDPVAISLDRHGRAYVTQTRRRKSQDLDIRQNRDWIPFDVGFRTVAEKRAFYRERLAPDRDDASKAKRVGDLNDDGSHDWRDLTVLDERIHVVTDTDGDGTADAIQLFADDFRTEVTGIAAGVLWTPGREDSEHGDVYTTIAPDVWRLRDTDGDGRADEREVVATGFGLHVAYAGHDMHGLTVGPDGRLYWTVGDKGISVVSGEGREFRYPNQGGVLRCDMDGSNFEVFAHGLRNVQELAFDEFGNLFGVDNDADQPGERERFVYIVKGMDAGWRCNYQYRGDGYNPWTDEKLWVPHFEGQAAYVTPPIAHSIDGPAGFARNPGTALSPAYRDHFFLTGAPGGKQIAFKVKPNGASFAMDDVHEIGSGIPLVGINFGPDGALYGVDWGGGYPLNQRGAIWAIDDPEHAGSEARREVATLLAAGPTGVSVDDLVRRLRHADQRIRLMSQFELVRRNEVDRLRTLAHDEDAPQLARIHTLWGLGQFARSGSIDGSEFAPLLTDDDPEIRTQAARVIADAPKFDGRSLLPLLEDANPRVRLQAALALAEHPTPDARGAIVEMLQENDGEDLYLRHAGIVALAGCGGAGELVDHPSEAVRVAAVVAMRRNRNATVARFLRDTSSAVVAEVARAIHDDGSLPEALPALAGLLDAPPFDDEPTMRRAINAAFRLGRSEDAIRVARYAADVSNPRPMRQEALDALRQWTEPPVLDRVDGRNRHTVHGERPIPADELSPHLSAAPKDEFFGIRVAALDAVPKLGMRVDEDALLGILNPGNQPTANRIAAFNVLVAQKSDRVGEAIDRMLKSNVPALRSTALRALVDRNPKQAGVVARMTFLSDRRRLYERQTAMNVLGDLQTDLAKFAVAEAFGKLQTRRLESDVAFEVLEAVAKHAETSAELAEQFAAFVSARKEAAATDPIARFTECLDGGDHEAGRKIFATNVTAQCIRCHRVGKEGSDVGPKLDGIATKRKPEHLLRAIVAPSADIEEKYRSRLLVLDSGKTVRGMLRRRSDDATILVDVKGKELRIPNDTIEAEVEQNVSIMPDLVKELSRREVRDLVAYLRTLREGKK